MTGNPMTSKSSVTPRPKTQALAITAEQSGVRLEVTLTVAPSSSTIATAGHHGARTEQERQVLDELCRVIAGRPPQEAAEHGTLYVMKALPQLCAKVSGIVTPRNAGAEFGLAERLIREIATKARAQLNEKQLKNLWYERASRGWRDKTEADQAVAAKPILAALLGDSGFGSDDAWISRIERGTRLTIDFSPSVSYASKPTFMMQLEKRLRSAIGEPLEVFLDEVKDANKIRRL